MVALAQKIKEETEKLDAYLKANGLPSPGFDEDSPSGYPKLPADIQTCRQQLIQATRELNELSVGPQETIRWTSWSNLDVLALQLIAQYKLATLVPVGGTITLEELASKTSLDAVNVARVIRLAATNRIFREPSPGVFAHTAASRVLAENESLQIWTEWYTEEIFPASAHVLEALRRYPEAAYPTRTGFNFAFDTVDKEPMFVTFGKNPTRAKRMGQAMASLSTGEGFELSYFSDVEAGGYDMSSIDAAGGTFVDLGGSHGVSALQLVLGSILPFFALFSMSRANTCGFSSHASI
jgi:hypothetical protein